MKNGYLFSLKTVMSDVFAGVTLGIESIPDGMANGLLVSVLTMISSFHTGTLIFGRRRDRGMFRLS